jgi:hypothetical protein
VSGGPSRIVSSGEQLGDSVAVDETAAPRTGGLQLAAGEATLDCAEREPGDLGDLARAEPFTSVIIANVEEGGGFCRKLTPPDAFTEILELLELGRLGATVAGQLVTVHADRERQMPGGIGGRERD